MCLSLGVGARCGKGIFVFSLHTYYSKFCVVCVLCCKVYIKNKRQASTGVRRKALTRRVHLKAEHRLIPPQVPHSPGIVLSCGWPGLPRAGIV